MIRLMENELPRGFVSGNDVVSGRLSAWWEAYSRTKFAQFFETEHGGCIGMMDTQAIVCAPQEDGEEIGAFLQMQPTVGKVYTTLPDIMSGKVTRFTAMSATHTPNVCGLNSPALQELYTFLKSYFDDLPPFEPWYLDVSYRTRHGLCRQTVIKEDGGIASAAMTVAEWGNGALIGGVATDPAFRCCGYAGQCVNALTAALQKEGKTVWICPYNESAHRLYLSLGFVDRGTVTVIERM